MSRLQHAVALRLDRTRSRLKTADDERRRWREQLRNLPTACLAPPVYAMLGRLLDDFDAVYDALVSQALDAAELEMKD